MIYKKRAKKTPQWRLAQAPDGTINGLIAEYSGVYIDCLDGSWRLYYRQLYRIWGATINTSEVTAERVLKVLKFHDLCGIG